MIIGASSRGERVVRTRKHDVIIYYFIRLGAIEKNSITLHYTYYTYTQCAYYNDNNNTCAHLVINVNVCVRILRIMPFVVYLHSHTCTTCLLLNNKSEKIAYNNIICRYACRRLARAFERMRVPCAPRPRSRCARVVLLFVSNVLPWYNNARFTPRLSRARTSC
jgi:hypothetical protein